jgi:glycosyltransferase involved in cell wall biosynthesis
VNQPSIAVVIPCYDVASHVLDVIAQIPSLVQHVVLVDDASPDNLHDVLAAASDPRLVVVRHAANRGVGGAMKSGFVKAIDMGAEIVVKLDGDGQMDPGLIPQFVAPIVMGQADFTKGNRFGDRRSIRQMPIVRRFGNIALSFLVKGVSGYWQLFDPCNGYLAIRAAVLQTLDFNRLDERYFFEISLICELYLANAVVRDIPMRPVYTSRPGSLSPIRSIGDFAPRLMARSIYRVFRNADSKPSDLRGVS